MSLDPLSVAVGAGVMLVAAGAYRRVAGRGGDRRAREAVSYGVRCVSCGATYPDRSEGRDHARSAHNAFTDDMADQLLERVEVDP